MLKKIYVRLTHLISVVKSFTVTATKLKKRIAQVKRKSANRKIIAISLVEHLGDIVSCEPVSRYVRQQDPDAFILWVVRQPYRDLIDGNPNIDETVVVHCLTVWIWLLRLRLFDEVVDLHLQGRVCLTCGIPLDKTSPLANKEIQLKSYYNYGCLLSSFSQGAGLKLPDANEAPKVYIPQIAVERVDAMNLPKAFIVMHAMANESARNWQTEKWQAVIEEVWKRHGLYVAEVGMHPVIQSPLPNYINLCGKQLSILETAEVIRRSVIFIGIDSGPSHLANAVGTFGILLLGDYHGFKNHISHSGKYKDGTNASLIYADGPASEIPLTQVTAAVEKRIAVMKSLTT